MSGSAFARVFIAAAFANSFLLFVLEPLFGKLALPHLGGTAAVWTTCLLFYQTALLIGYLYAHVLASRVPLKAQVAVHLVLLCAAASALPVSVPPGWEPSNIAAPTGSLILLLTRRLGAPFVLLAAGSPLLQAWLARDPVFRVGDPYTLYAASNLGSAAALIIYPFACEPLLHVSTQARAWSVGYLMLCGLIVACTLVLIRPQGVEYTAVERRPSSALGPTRVAWSDRLRWLALAAVPSSLLLGVTTHLTTNLAPVPLLWIVPLSVYLATFVAAFHEGGRLAGLRVQGALPYLVLAVATAMVFDGELPGIAGYGLHVVAFAACALACHIRLADSRPSPSNLTEFYLWISFGGAIGGAFNVFVAPTVFSGVAEYPLALVAATALSRGTVTRRADIAAAIAVTAAVFALTAVILRFDPSGGRLALTAVAMGGALAAFRLRARPVPFAIGVGAILVSGATFHLGTTRLAARSFYGVYRVIDDSTRGLRLLYSGTTIHGSERLADSAGGLVGRQPEPLTYYHHDGPLGTIFANHTPESGPWRVGVIGLGAGSAASYAQPSDSWTFYEIDPLVARIAADARYFRFLSMAAVRPRIVLGDARMSLARDLGARYDVLIIDAFSSDAIPVHLLTKEALELYRAHLAPGGIIAWHISNNALDLRPVLAGLSDDAHMMAFIDADFRVRTADAGHFASIWVVMTTSRPAISAFDKDGPWSRLVVDRPRLWTDDFSNIVALIR